MDKLFTLLIMFQMKHFLCDFPLQTSYMLGKFKGGLAWILPLFSHCLVHSLFTLFIIFVFNQMNLWWLVLVDFGCHFIIDRIKASPSLGGRFESLTKKDFSDFSGKNNILMLNSINNERWKERVRSNMFFWWTLGLDQFFHHLTHYFIIWNMLK